MPRTNRLNPAHPPYLAGSAALPGTDIAITLDGNGVLWLDRQHWLAHLDVPLHLTLGSGEYSDYNDWYAGSFPNLAALMDAIDNPKYRVSADYPHPLWNGEYEIGADAELNGQLVRLFRGDATPHGNSSYPHGWRRPIKWSLLAGFPGHPDRYPVEARCRQSGDWSELRDWCLGQHLALVGDYVAEAAWRLAAKRLVPRPVLPTRIAAAVQEAHERAALAAIPVEQEENA